MFHCYLHHCLITSYNIFQGPYNVVLESLKDCAEKGSGEITVTAKARTDENGKIVHTGYLKLPFGLTDKLKVNGLVKVKLY